VGYPLGESEWQHYAFEEVHQPPPLPFSLVTAECLLPRLASFTVMDYNVPVSAFIKKDIWTGRNLLLPNYVGHIGVKPVYDMDGPLESIDDIIIRTDRGVREVTTEEWRKLEGSPPHGVPLRKIGGGLFWSLSYNVGVGSRTRDRAKAGPGLVKKIADLMIFNQSKGKSGSYAHAARVGMQNHSKGKSLLHLTSLE
jgi:hypothetical protein